MRLPSRRRSPVRKEPAAGRPAPGRRPGSKGGTGRAAEVAGSRRSQNRPGQQRRHPAVPAGRRPAPAGTSDPRSAARRRGGWLTGRATVLGIVLCIVVLTLAYPMREYLAQRSEISQLSQQQRAQRDQVKALEQRRRQWDDPAYVRVQARKRLQYVMPGDVGFVVIDPGGQPGARKGGQPVTIRPPESARNSAWYSRLWGTVQGADAAR